MQHLYICPDCRSGHTEPADAHFVLHALCLDCALGRELEAARPEPPLVAAAA